MSDLLRQQLDTLAQALCRPDGDLAELRARTTQLLVDLREQTEIIARREAAYRSLVEISRQLTVTPDVTQILELILDRSIELTNAERGFLVLCTEEEPTTKVCTARYRQGYSARGNGQYSVPSETILRVVFQDRKTTLTTNAQLDPRFASSQSVAGYGVRSVLCAPLILHDELLGALYLDSRHQVYQFTNVDLQAMSALAAQAAAAIGLAKLIAGLMTKNDELRQALDSVQRMRLELTRSERLSTIGQVAASVIHDLRGPMTSIKGYAVLLAKEDVLPEDRQYYSEAIISGAERFGTISQEILEFVRGERALSARLVSIPDFVADLYAQLQADFAERGIKLITDVRYMGEVIVDGLRLSRAMLNIANNARQAMPNGGEFTLRVSREADGLELRLSDTGPGVPEAIRHSLFDPFVTQGKGTGIGLGLAIARKIIEDHDGTLQLASSDGPGATFIVNLPATRLPPAEQPANSDALSLLE